MVHEELLLGRNASLGGNSIQPSVNETRLFFFFFPAKSSTWCEGRLKTKWAWNLFSTQLPRAVCGNVLTHPLSCLSDGSAPASPPFSGNRENMFPGAHGHTWAPPVLCFAGAPNLRDLTPDDLRWSWCNYNRNKVHNHHRAPEASPNHPLPGHGKIVFHKTGLWYQKSWGLLL